MSKNWSVHSLRSKSFFNVIMLCGGTYLPFWTDIFVKSFQVKSFQSINFSFHLEIWNVYVWFFCISDWLPNLTTLINYFIYLNFENLGSYQAFELSEWWTFDAPCSCYQNNLYFRMYQQYDNRCTKSYRCNTHNHRHLRGIDCSSAIVGEPGAAGWKSQMNPLRFGDHQQSWDYYIRYGLNYWPRSWFPRSIIFARSICYNWFKEKLFWRC